MSCWVALLPFRFDPTPIFIIINGLTDVLQAAKAYEDHCAANGKPDSHAKAKELLYILLRVSGRCVYSL